MTIEDYTQVHCLAEDKILYQLYRETHLTMMHPRMLSGAVQGAFLQWMVATFAAKNVLEIGTFTGYSTICMARGLVEGGKLITIEKNEELEAIAQRYFTMAGLHNSVQQLIGDAAELIPTLEDKFDLVFLDADKKNYPLYLQQLLPKITTGGILIADNVLWNGKVVQPLQHNDKDTAGVLAFNKMVQENPELHNILLPIRDGLMLFRKM